MPKIAALGSLSSRGFGEFAQQTAANYIEDVFSTYLYTGNGSTQTITNGVDLSTKGGMVWLKSRNVAGFNYISDTDRGTLYQLVTSTTSAQQSSNNYVTSFNSNGFNLGANPNINNTNDTFASWTFREQPKFFDVVTYTGTGVATTISHNLGSVPGMIIVKQLNTARSWQVYHRSIGSGAYIILNSTSAQLSSATRWNNTNPTSTVFSVGADTTVNELNGTYVAYLFAHNAGGFGADGSQNVISCGSFTDTSGAITLGYEPQFILYKLISTADNWNIIDTMRGMDVSANTKNLYPNTSGAEASSFGPYPTATGFQVAGVPTGTYIYMAIRRGPMRTPTSGTSVFVPSTNGYGVATTTNFPVDLYSAGWSSSNSGQTTWWDRLRGGYSLVTSSTGAQGTFDYTPYLTFANNTTFTQTADSNSNRSWFFQRAPGFFDVVCYTGTGSNRTVNHNLTVAPELMIIKRRSSAESWFVYAAPIGNTKYTLLNYNLGVYTDSTFWNNTTPTASVFTLGTNTAINNSGDTYVSYLFASCPGVSKVGNYTGTGATQTISCGFTGGARYVLIKRTDSTGDWWVWDTARGMVAGTDPRLAYNSTAAETNANWVYTTTGGFQIVTSDATVNASGGSYIYLAIA